MTVKRFVISLPSGLIPSISNSRVFVSKIKKLIINPKFYNRMQKTALLIQNAIGKITVEYALCVLFLGKRKVEFDSHNFSKTLGDILEKIGFVKNDRCLEVICLKSTHFGVNAKKDVIWIFGFKTLTEFTKFLRRQVFSERLQKCFGHHLTNESVKSQKRN